MMSKCKVDTDFDRQIREAFKVRSPFEGKERGICLPLPGEVLGLLLPTCLGSPGAHRKGVTWRALWVDANVPQMTADSRDDIISGIRVLLGAQFFDTDGSGAIDTKELGSIMRKLGAKLSDDEIKLLVQEADANGDGQVDINEVREP